MQNLSQYVVLTVACEIACSNFVPTYGTSKHISHMWKPAMNIAKDAEKVVEDYYLFKGDRRERASGTTQFGPLIFVLFGCSLP